MLIRKGSVLRLRRNELALGFGGGFPRLSWTRSVTEIGDLAGADELPSRRPDGDFAEWADEYAIESHADRIDSDYGPPDVEPGEEYALAANVEVRSALMIDPLVDDEFACSVPASMPGVQIGDQVRVMRNASEYALYTVMAKRALDNPKTVRMNQSARQRMGTGTEFAGSMRLPVPAAGNLTDAQAQAASEFVERLVDDGSYNKFVAMAPHGGKIEFNTDLQAAAVTAALDCSSWICKGYRSGGGSYTRWHITATRISPNSFPGLGLIAKRQFNYGIAFHGMSSGGVLIGGRAPVELKMILRAAIVDALDDGSIEVKIASANSSNSGTSAKNLCNWMTLDGTGGIQLEQGPKVRQDHWQDVANAVIDVYSQLL